LQSNKCSPSFLWNQSYLFNTLYTSQFRSRILSKRQTSHHFPTPSQRSHCLVTRVSIKAGLLGPLHHVFERRIVTHLSTIDMMTLLQHGLVIIALACMHHAQAFAPTPPMTLIGAASKGTALSKLYYHDRNSRKEQEDEEKNRSDRSHLSFVHVFF
jgi:hypothetical protein